MKLLAIAKYLHELGLAEMGKNLFVNEMPTEVLDGILLRDSNGGTAINHYLPLYRDTEISVAVRSPDYERGQALAYSLLAPLTIQGDRQLDQILVKKLLPMNEPRPYRRSVAGNWEFEIDVEIAYVLTASP